jgi:flagellar hook-length control protein FliK
MAGDRPLATPIIITGPQTPQSGGVSVHGDAAGDAAAFSALLDLLTGGVFTQGENPDLTAALGTGKTPPETQSTGANPLLGNTDIAGGGEPGAAEDPLVSLLAELDALIDQFGNGELSGEDLTAALASLEELATNLLQTGPLQAASTEGMQKAAARLDELAIALDGKAPVAQERLQTIAEKLQTALHQAQAAQVAGDTEAAPAKDASRALAAQTTDQPPGNQNQTSGADHRAFTAAQQGADTGQSGAHTGDRGQNPAAQLALLAARPGSEAADAKGDAKPGTDPFLSLSTGQTTRSDALATIRPALAAYGRHGQTLNMPQIGFEIARQVQNGLSRFQIQLNPPELGRIDVRMDLDHNGSLNARLTVDRAETLDMLQRDARALERALSQAGLDGSKTNLEFALRQDAQGRQDNGGEDGFAGLFDEDDAPDETGAAIPPVIQHGGTLSPGSISLWV